MSLFSIFEWAQSTDLGTHIRESTLAYPLIMGTHLSGMAVFGGMILMSDLRLLGLALTDYSIHDVVGGLRPWKRLGFVITVTCGALLAGAEAVKYYYNPYFWTKMIILALILVHAIVFRPLVYNRTAELDKGPVPGVAKLAAILSLLLWAGMVSMGRLIGYFEGYPPGII